MPTPSELVTDAFALAREYVESAEVKLETFVDQLNTAIQVAPLVDLEFNPVAAPSTAAPPTYTAPTPYSSSLLTSLAAALTTRLAGGTGLAPAVEAAIWDRARDRESATAQAAIDTITREAEALGYELPPGVVADGIRRETRAFYDKTSTFSRDVAIKQAELEQANMQKTIDQVREFEVSLAEIITKRASMALDEFRAAVEVFRAEVEQEVKHWEAQIAQYKAQADYIMAGQRINSEVIRANLATVLEAGKIGAQVYSQLVAAAYSLIRASASVSASASNSVGYSYSNDTDIAPPAVTAV
jgi:uncharacterized protein YoxC